MRTHLLIFTTAVKLILNISIQRKILKELKLPFSKIVAQCYDGASNMNGRHKGLATRVSQENPMAIYTHCYNHQLNLALESTCCDIAEVRNAVGTSKVIHNFIKASAKRNDTFKSLQREHNLTVVKGKEDLSKLSIKPLSGTRWASRDKAFESITENFKIIVQTLTVCHHKLFNLFNK